MIDNSLFAVRVGVRESEVLEIRLGRTPSYYLLRVQIEGGPAEGTWGWLPREDVPDALRDRALRELAGAVVADARVGR
jgi:hypothetical protein